MKARTVPLVAALMIVASAGMALPAVTQDGFTPHEVPLLGSLFQGEEADSPAPTDAPTTQTPPSDPTQGAPGAGKAPDARQMPDPIVGAPDPGASPLEMTESLLGPTPEELRLIDPQLPLEEALRQHPAFPSGPPSVEQPLLKVAAMENALSRLIQAHGVMTELQEAASQGDPVAQDLLPYAAAQLANEAETTGPTFNALSDAYTASDTELHIHQDPQPVQQAASLQDEVDRLYTLLDLPRTPVDAGVHDADELARLVHATADVVQATHNAKQAQERAQSLEEDLKRVDAALKDGALSPEDAALLTDVATAVHEVTTQPLQQRLTALDQLHATSQAVVPHLHLASSTPIQDVQAPLDGHEPGTLDDVLALLPGEDEDPPTDAEEIAEDVEALANETEDEQATNETEEEVQEAIRPVSEELEENFVDPLGLIVILGEEDDHVDGEGEPVPVEVPGVGAVGSLFPRSPLLVVAQGGDNTYENFPRTMAAEDTVQGTGEALVDIDAFEGALPVDPRSPVPEFGPAGPFLAALNSIAEFTYPIASEAAGTQQGLELAFEADTPMQVVVDLDGNDRYIGEKGAAYAAGGGTAAVYDDGGDDVFDVKRGVGLIEEDGVAIVKSFSGNDTIRAERGVGSIVQPFTVNDEGEVEFEEGFRYRIGGMGAFINFEGDNTYDVNEAGIGVGFQEITTVEPGMSTGDADFHYPLEGPSVPLALDLADDADGFEPVIPGWEIEPTGAVEEHGGAEAKAWIAYHLGGEVDQGGFSWFVDDASPSTETLKQVTAAHRSYDVSLDEPTSGTIHANDLNVTLGGTGTIQPFHTPTVFIGLFGTSQEGAVSFELHNEILVHLDDKERVYEPPHPLILIDAGDTDDVYHDVGPSRMIANTTGFGAENHNVWEDDVTVAPNLALDTRGNDRYLGETASLNTTRLAQELRTSIQFDNDDATDIARAPASGSVLVDMDGDDTFDGNVSSVDVDMTLSASTMTSLVHNMGGSDTIQGGQAGGISVTHAQTAGAFLSQDGNVGHSITSLLLMGTQDPENERNTFDVDAGSMGSVIAHEQHPDDRGEIDANTRLTAGALVAGPSDYESPHHSFASVYWCEANERCPEVQSGAGTTGMDDERPQITALFIGGNAPNTYTLESPDAIGHVTLDLEVDTCSLIPAGFEGDNDPRVTETPPAFTTRFVDVGGPTVYEMTDRDEDLPPWRNDHAWNPVGATDQACPQTQIGHPLAGESVGTEDVAVGEAASVQTIDTFAIDNLGQYVLGAAGDAALGSLEDATGLEFEPPRLCAGPFAVAENGSTLRGFQEPTFRCAERDDTRVLSTNPLLAQERLLVMTKTQGNVPANAFGAVNPCDTGQQGDRSLELDARAENVPDGNPLAQGTSGCWAMLEVKKIEQQPTTSPIWHETAPSGEGWLDIMASPIQCGYTDDRSMVVKCATDALPVPYHVDGSGGYNLDRWFLPEGTYEYRMTLNGPISAIMADETMLTGRLEIDREPLLEEQEVPGYGFPVETRVNAGLLAWLETADANADAPGALEGFNVRVVHQDDVGAPEEIEVWSPFQLPQHRDLAPGACLDETPYRGLASEAEKEWRGDRGHWVTTYPLELWENDPPEACDNVDEPATLDVQGQAIPVDTGIWHAPFGEEPQRIDLPDEATTDTVTVDDEEPSVTLLPIPGPDGEPIMALTADELDTIGLGIQDLNAPRVSGNIGTDDIGAAIYIEIPFNVTSDSPMTELRFAGVTDNPRDENIIHATGPEDSPSKPGDFTEGILLTWDHDDEDGFTPCSPRDEEAPACVARLNHSRAGQAPDGSWYRQAGLNLTLHLDEPDEDPQNDRQELHEAIERSLQGNEQLVFEVLGDDDIEVEDEAGNELSKRVDEVVLDLSRPLDLAFPCRVDGLQVITRNETVQLRTYIDEDAHDDIQGLLIERAQGDAWTVQDWVWMDDMTRVGPDCEPDTDGQWLAFDYTATDATEGEIVRHELRTIPVDSVGNRALSFGPFELAVTVDQKAPKVNLTQTHATPQSATVHVASQQPITLDPDAHLVGPDGDEHPPQFISDERDTEHELVFEDLTVNTTYEITITGEDEAGNTGQTSATVRSAKTLNLTLAPLPEAVGDQAEIRYEAGALALPEDGDPQTRVEASATAPGGQEPCITRSIDQYVHDPIDAPGMYTLTLPLTECPGGDLLLGLTVENGPRDDPIETVTLSAPIQHDKEAPTPQVDIEGERSENGWYTTPVRVTPTGTDDTGILHAVIDTQDGPLQEMTIDESGVHEITVTATDAANRSTTDTIDVPIDLSPPTVDLVSLDALPTQRSTIAVQILGVDDASGLDSIRTLQTDGTFSDWSPVVDGMQLLIDISGLDEVIAEVRDRAGHTTHTLLPVTSLADAPSVKEGSLTVASPGSVHVKALLDRPLPLEATVEQADRVVAQELSPSGDEHSFTITGLTPASEATVTVRAQLSDGSTAKIEEVSGTLTLPASQGPPSVPENLSADELDDGTVKVSWDAARDDAGIDRYLVERTTRGDVAHQASVTGTRILDEPEPGQTHEYRVLAIDASGHQGAWSSPITITPTAPLSIVSYAIEPEIAPAGSPVELTVVAEGDGAPASASITYGDDEIPLALEEGKHGRWVYTANVTLPATDTFFPEGIAVNLGEETFPEEGTFPGPVVKALDDGQVAQDPVPAPGLLALALALFLALATRRWRP